MADPVTLAGESTTLGYRDLGGSGTYTSVGNRVSIEGPNRTREKVDTTVMPDSTGTFYRTSRPSNLLDSGELQLKVYYNPLDTTHAFLTTQYAASSATAAKNWQIKFSDGSTLAGDGYITGFNITGMNLQNSLVTADVVITLTGALTLTPFSDPG